MIIDAAASWFLPRIVSMSWAADWAYSGRMFSADEALRAGLVRELHPADEVYQLSKNPFILEYILSLKKVRSEV
jgi:enoyl-CoA hydratase/carnithine racemase